MKCPTTAINKEVNLQLDDKAKKAMITKGLGLSSDDKQLVNHYYEISMQETLSDQNVAFIAYVWKKAVKDKKLAEALGAIDDMHPPCLAGEDLIAENIELRTHLSSYLPLIAAERLKRRKGELEEVEEGVSLIPLLCPNAGGIFYIKKPESKYVDIDGNQNCPRCGEKLEKHGRLTPSDQHYHIH